MKRFIIGLIVLLLIAAVGVCGWYLWDSLKKEKIKTSDLENRIVKIESVIQSGNVNQNNENDGNSTATTANEAIKKCLKDSEWVNNNISSGSAQSKFIKIANIWDSSAYVVDSNLNGKHTVTLIYYDGSKVVVKKKAVSDNYKNISVDPEHNILVLGSLRNYLNQEEQVEEVSLNIIDKNGFSEYGASGEVPTLNGQAVSFGNFKTRTESIKEQKIELELNESNIDKYVK